MLTDTMTEVDGGVPALDVEDAATIRTTLFARYIASQWNTRQERMDEGQAREHLNSGTKYGVEPIENPDGNVERSGSYSTVKFYRIYEVRGSGRSGRVAVKTNKTTLGMPNARDITTIETKILQGLADYPRGEGKPSFPLVECYGSEDNKIILEFLDGLTLEKHLRGQEVLPLPLIGDMLLGTIPDLHAALDDMIDRQHKLSPHEKDVLWQTPTMAVCHALPWLKPQRAGENYYTFKVLKSLKDSRVAVQIADAFEHSFKPVNDMLKTAPHTWLMHQHPRNSIYAPTNIEGVKQIVLFDANHVMPGYGALDEALWMSTLFQNQSTADPYIDAFAHGGIIERYIRRTGADKVDVAHLRHMREYLASLKDPQGGEQTRERSWARCQLYRELIPDMQWTLASYLFRTIQDWIEASVLLYREGAAELGPIAIQRAQTAQYVMKMVEEKSGHSDIGLGERCIAPLLSKSPEYDSVLGTARAIWDEAVERQKKNRPD